MCRCEVGHAIDAQTGFLTVNDRKELTGIFLVVLGKSQKTVVSVSVDRDKSARNLNAKAINHLIVRKPACELMRFN